MVGFHRRTFGDPPPTLLSKLKYIEHEDTFIVDKISHYTIPCNMHNFQTCWVRYPLWQAIADCRCNLSYHSEYRKRNGESHHPISEPSYLPDNEGWVNNVTYEERVIKKDVNSYHEWIEANINFYLARPFINSSTRKFYLGNRNGTWSFYGKNGEVLSTNNRVYHTGDNKFPIPIPDNCYRIRCVLSSHESVFGSWQWNNYGEAQVSAEKIWKFTHVRNIVSRLPLLVNTSKTLNNGIAFENPEIKGESVGCGKFFIQVNSRQEMVQLHNATTYRKSYYVRNKFAGADLWFQNYDVRYVAKQMQEGRIPELYTRIVRHKQHPALSHMSMIDVLWKSDVFLRLMHPKYPGIKSSGKTNIVRPDAVQHSLYSLCNKKFLKTNQSNTFSTPEIWRILTGRNLNSDNYISTTKRTEANYGPKALSEMSRFGFGNGFVRNGRFIKGKGESKSFQPQDTNTVYKIPFYLFVYLFPHKRHKRVYYRNALHCQWRLFEPPIAKGKFKMYSVTRSADYGLHFTLVSKTLL